MRVQNPRKNMIMMMINRQLRLGHVMKQQF